MKSIHTKGITILSARTSMWAVRVGDDLKSSASIKELAKYLANPEAKFGCWIEIRWVDQEAINKFKMHKKKGFIDLDTGEFFLAVKRDWSGENTWTGDKVTDCYEKLIVEEVAEHMMKKWQKRFEKEQRV
jgi:hypothetical protein